MAKGGWNKFPHTDKAYAYAGAALKKNWERLHGRPRALSR
jgi:hypothetical protein